MNEVAKKRPEFRNINVFHDVRTYRMPPAAILSILHRISGGIMFLLLPFLLWLFDMSVRSPQTFEQVAGIFREGLWIFPGFMVRLGVLVLVWAFLHHLCAGIRHIHMDVDHHAVDKHKGRKTAIASFAISLGLTAIFGLKILF
ncbi:succinate dehydrogenase, cytochrome b556 subunit [Allofranklinella schreckenbergeri]|uniref:Succinate dehydrogenase cytochrome b556 subunit n=1 Tax=Allofranklinella schreckenbergeri TaxID=1076744 RepID=A0A3M6Q4C9_9BURK|nr:succinate dehydrogenase, cytochrome b556 subunit [Allofranklinella schreckenbergeri]MDO4704779.1 succinate dehydrogenase, cytochrome b556 subunit [Comamonadaceae bacterium]RRD44247.1 succinate dehydrogenase, cytochrome b556 subunit [Comamonadaceae bacterium OH3737_COT-264]RMW97644.1 succinate dehydrogenase, cytochrome b556 subunit [Allofranklinella schreckenbergeri]RMX02754.1 succinate dehydrogenase, cytochrome b556 subunit [Allofranklinella schreckenbergeri]RMX11393.1 succinate dehydrogena